MKYLGSENTVPDAIVQILIYLSRGEKDILVKNTGAQSGKYRKLYKRICKYAVCNKTSEGFVVIRIAPRGYHLIFS